MARWKVRTYRAGVWDGHAPTTIESQTLLQAAEQVCGIPLVEGPGPYGTYRAAVWSPDDITVVTYFYPQKQLKPRSIQEWARTPRKKLERMVPTPAWTEPPPDPAPINPPAE